MTLKSDPHREKLILEKPFLCDAVNLKQSLEGTLKV